MDINNNQLINTFLKGMNTDVSDALIDSSQYRYAENLRLVTNTDSNSGELRLIEGVGTFEVPTEMANIKAFTSIRNILIIIDSEDTIWKYDYGEWFPIYKRNTEYDNDPRFGLYLSLVTRWEHDTLVKLYIADGQNPLMYINIREGGVSPTTLVGIENIYADIKVFVLPLEAQISELSGSIKAVKVQYAYRYYKLGGAATSLSPLSNVVTIYKGPNEGYRTSDENTTKAVTLTFPQFSNESLNNMLVYRISYQQIGQPAAVDMIYDGPIISGSDWTDTGYSVESMSLAELISTIKLNITPTVIESKNDYLFAANMSYHQSEWDKELVVDTRSYSKGDSMSQDGYNIQFSLDNILLYNPEYWYKPNSSTVLGGTGSLFNWQYCVNRIYLDKDGNKYKDAELTQLIVDQVASLRPGEVYRYGAVFYSDDGTKSSVRWIADIMIPQEGIPNLNVTFRPEIHVTENRVYYEMVQIGIKFSIDGVLPQNCSAVEIVRCPRTQSDRITITQGFGGYPFRLYKADTAEEEYRLTDYICPTGILSSNPFYATSDDADEHDYGKHNRAKTDSRFFMLASPEYAYQKDDIESIIKANKYNLSLRVDYTNIQPVEFGTHHVGSTGVAQDFLINIKSRDEALNHAFAYSMDGDTWVFNWISTWLNLHDDGATETYDLKSRIVKESFFDTWYRNLASYLVMPEDYGSSLYNKTYKIESFAFPEVPNMRSFINDQGSAEWNSSITAVGTSGVLYCGWSTPLLLDVANAAEHMKNMDSNGYDLVRRRFPVFYPVGSTGKCIVIETNQQMDIVNSGTGGMAFPTVSIISKKQPYGGKQSVDYSKYISNGNVINRVDSSIEVYDGDCYPGVFAYNASHAWYEPNTPMGIRSAGFYIVPLYSDIDLSATCGHIITRLESGKKYYAQDTEVSLEDRFTQTQPAYIYNTAYGAMPNAVEDSAVLYTDADTSNFDTRVHYSEVKTNGEHIDNWLNFKSANFLDVDSRFGEITNLRLFKDKLLYWLNNATGVLSVNERVVLNDIDENQIILGTGSVLQRYDYISTTYGMKKYQYEAETQSNTTQYWWDGNNKEILAYSEGAQLMPLTKVKNVSNYINGKNETRRPSLLYDKKYNELISKIVSSNNSLVYNELIQQFTSIYTFGPEFRTTVNDKLYLTKVKKIFTWNDTYKAGESNLFDKSGEISKAYPMLEYIVNKDNIYNKTFDITTFGGRFYGGDNLNSLSFTYSTPLKQYGRATGNNFITNREYDFRLTIPRNENSSYGDRMRGKTMQCELSSSSNSTDFSLQYVITKYRMSWS